jgi:hypothetical protein
MLPPLVTLQHCLTVTVFDAVPLQVTFVTVTLYVPDAVTEIDGVVAPLLQIYKLPALPPFAVNDNGPEAKHCVLNPLMLIAGFSQGSVHGAITPLPVAVHPLASVTVTLKFPALHNPPIDDVVAPLLHMYVNGAVPLVTLAVTLAVQVYNLIQSEFTSTVTLGLGLTMIQGRFDSPAVQSSHPALRLQRKK